MRRNAALVTMLAAELCVALLAIFFYVHTRVSILAAFHDFGTEIPRATAIALSSWWTPSALAFAGVCSIAAIVAPVPRSQRALVAGIGLVVASAALVFAVWAAFSPLFQPA